MELTNILLIILICACYTGFGINYLKGMVQDQCKKDGAEIPFFAKILLFLFWWIEVVALFTWDAKKI